MSGRKISIKGFAYKDGKLVKRQPRLSVSAKIAARKNPKRRYGRAITQ